MVTSCDLPHGDLYGFLTVIPVRHSDVAILGSGHVQLYPLDIFPTHSRRALRFAVRGSLRGEISSFIYHGRTTTLCLLVWCLLG